MGSELEAIARGTSGRTAAGLGPMSNTDSSRRRRFAIALSFPGERREYVEQVANALLPAFGGEQGKSRIFYDAWHEGLIIGFTSNRKLQSIYLTESDLIVPFFCQDYRKKKWCEGSWGHTFRFRQAR